MGSDVRRALVTGGSRGIGRAITLELARRGHDVAIGYLMNRAAALEVAGQVEALGRRALVVEGDLRDVKVCKAVVKEAAEALGGLDVLVSNAAIGAHRDAMKLRSSHWDLTLESSTRPLLLLTQAALPHLKLRRGTVIALSSLGSRRVVPGYAAMGSAKAALEALVRYLAVELAPQGIRVNCVCGGLINTDALNYLKEGAEMLAAAAEHTPLGRVGQPEDLARVVGFLASEESRWICGQSLVVDGGLSLM